MSDKLLIEALRQIAEEQWMPELTCEFEADARYVWPKKQARIIQIAKDALALDKRLRETQP